jgi:hypothetical protein
MLNLLLKPNIVRRLNHSHSKTFFPESKNKGIEDLMREQNENLKKISLEISNAGQCISILLIILAFKPMK